MSAESIEIRKLARAFFRANALGPNEQTRICLFFQAIKSINATILARVEFQPFEWLPYKFLHNQYFRELELSTLLGRSTAWTTNPFVYLDATNLNLAVWRVSEASRYLQRPMRQDRLFYEYLALSHAFMAETRILPLLPPEKPLDTRFLVVLKDIDEENGRQIQTQIRLLKDLQCGLERDTREYIVEEQRVRVAGLFERLLREIAVESVPDGTKRSAS